MNAQLVEMGLRIRSRRKELRIRQAELAELIGVSNNHMSSIERGVGNPSIHVFIRICEELSVTPDYLLLGNMHTNNISQNILDNLSLCSSEDLNIINDIIKLYVQKNQKTGIHSISLRLSTLSQPKLFIFCLFIPFSCQ